MSKSDSRGRHSSSPDGPSNLTSIRIDVRAARGAYDAARKRRMLIEALMRHDDPAMPKGENAEGYKGDLRVANAERALLLAAAEFVGVTSWGEAAALFALMSDKAQAMNPHKRKRGAPKKNGSLVSHLKMANVVLELQIRFPGLSRAKIIREKSEMIKDGMVTLEGYVPSSGADITTLEKRVKRALAAAFAARPKGGT